MVLCEGKHLHDYHLWLTGVTPPRGLLKTSRPNMAETVKSSWEITILCSFSFLFSSYVGVTWFTLSIPSINCLYFFDDYFVWSILVIKFYIFNCVHGFLYLEKGHLPSLQVTPKAFAAPYHSVIILDYSLLRVHLWLYKLHTCKSVVKFHMYIKHKNKL